MRKCDVFSPIDDHFDLILSFNLLQRNYFPPARIKQGVENLGCSLNEGGVLVIGDTTTFAVYRKFKQDLRPVWQGGDLCWPKFVPSLAHDCT